MSYNYQASHPSKFGKNVLGAYSGGMGRGTSEQRFTRVFGRRRGLGVDLRNSASAEGIVSRLVREAVEGDLAIVLSELAPYSEALGELETYHHLQRVVEALILRMQESVQISSYTWASAAMELAGIKAKESPSRHIVAWHRSGGEVNSDGDILHIWPDGEKIQGSREPYSAPLSWNNTLCEREMHRGLYHRAPRGWWLKAKRGDKEFRATLCKKCAKLADGFPDTEEDADCVLYVPQASRELEDALREGARADVLHGLIGGEEELSEFVMGRASQLVIQHVAKLCAEEGAWSLLNALTFEQARSLKDEGKLHYDDYVRWASFMNATAWEIALLRGKSTNSAKSVSEELQHILRLRLRRYEF